MNSKFMRNISLSTAVLLGGVALAQGVQADGTEGLGTPSVAIESGTGIIGAGTGLRNGPGMIDIDVPSEVQQVLLYWGCFAEPGSQDNDITVNGILVTGDPVAGIGGPTTFFSNIQGATFRADITGLGLVSAGPNLLDVDGLDCGFSTGSGSNGAGVLVIYDDLVSPLTDIQVRDGNDLAFINFATPLDTTVAQTFTFAASAADRTADLVMFFHSVSDEGLRPSSIDITVGGTTTELNNVLASNDGSEWDTVNVSVDVPAGADMLTVQALSIDRLGTGKRPASFDWGAAAFSLSSPPLLALSCVDGKPVELVFAYTPTGCSTTNEQEGKFNCSGVLDSAIASVASPDGTITFMGSTVTITASGDKFGAQTDMSITDVNGNVQDISIHTSCSKELNVGDIFGSLELTVFVPGTSGGGMGGMGGMGM